MEKAAIEGSSQEVLHDMSAEGAAGIAGREEGLDIGIRFLALAEEIDHRDTFEKFDHEMRRVVKSQNTSGTFS